MDTCKIYLEDRVSMALNLRTPHETRHRGRLAMVRSAFETPIWRVGGGPAKNRLAPSFDPFGRLDHRRQSVDMGDTLNASIQRRCRAYRIGPMGSAGMCPQVRRLANRRRNAYPPAAMAERLPGRVDNRPCGG